MTLPGNPDVTPVGFAGIDGANAVVRRQSKSVMAGVVPGLRRRRVGRHRLRDFYVVPGAPPGAWQEWVFLFGGIAGLMLAPLAGSRWWQESLRRR